MTHELLLYFHWSARLIETRTICVPKRVPADRRVKTRFPGGTFDMPLLDFFLVIWFACREVGKHPVVILRKCCGHSPGEQQLR